MALDAGSLEAKIRDLANGGWDELEAFLERDPVEKASRRKDALSADDKVEIRNAWAAFAASPSGEKALQDLIDRTLNRSNYITHLGMSAEQIAIYGARREAQNEVVNQILNLIRLAREEATKQRDQQ